MNLRRRLVSCSDGHYFGYCGNSAYRTIQGRRVRKQEKAKLMKEVSAMDERADDEYDGSYIGQVELWPFWRVDEEWLREIGD